MEMIKVLRENEMRNLYLIGFMGCGKSTVSDCFERTYGMRKFEMDEEIVKQEGRSIADIFAEKGEAYFREAETNLLKSLGSRDNLVVSCGGGTAMRQCNVDEMKKNGTVVLLNALPETIYERVKDTHHRPLLEGKMNVDDIRILMETRKSGYEAAADFAIMTDGKSTEEICREILACLGEK